MFTRLRKFLSKDRTDQVLDSDDVILNFGEAEEYARFTYLNNSEHASLRRMGDIMYEDCMMTIVDSGQLIVKRSSQEYQDFLKKRKQLTGLPKSS